MTFDRLYSEEKHKNRRKMNVEFSLITVFITQTLCENILFVTLVSSPSHHIWNEALIEGLLRNGHNVTLIGHSNTELIHENYTVFEIEGARNLYYDMVQVSSLRRYTPIANIFSVWDFNYKICQHDLASPVLQTLLNYPEHSFDLMVYDLHSGQCLYPLIEHFGSPPVVGVSAFGLPPFIADVMGAHVYSYVPFYTLPYGDKMNKLQRMYNSILQTMDSIIKWCFYMPVMYKHAQAAFHGDIRCFQEVEHSVSVLLTNNDPVLDYPQPFPPNIIPVGGLHVKTPEKLPKDLCNIFESSTDGVIYVSIGTDFIAKDMAEEMEDMLVAVFAKVNQTILWRYKNDGVDVPDNVVVRKAFPQNDILGNPKVKLFITHCGWLDIQEAIHHGVPLIGVPIFIDQRNNAAKIVSKKIGQTLDYTSLSQKLLHETINDILDNTQYKTRVERLSKLFKDQPQKPLERAIFWMEYILRNNNSEHLNTSERYMCWYEKVSTEVLIITTLSLSLFIYAMHSIYLLIANAVKSTPMLETTKKRKTKVKQKST